MKELLRLLRTMSNVDEYEDIKVEFIEDKAKISFSLPKEKTIYLLNKIEEKRKQEEYKKKYLQLKDRINDIGIKYLISREMVDPEELIKYLPEKDILEKDISMYQRACDLSCGYYSTDEGILSLEIAKTLAKGESLDKYPEKLQYHYYVYPETEQSVEDALFTKTEFLESIKKKKVLTKKR